MKEKNKRKMHGGASAKSYTGLVLTCVMTAIAVIYVGFAIYFEVIFALELLLMGLQSVAAVWKKLRMRSGLR